jgi:vancomycin resistance protein YoaR
VERILSGSIELVGPAGAPKSRWVLLPEDLASMLILQQKVETGGQVVGVAALSESALLRRAQAIAKELDRPAVEGKVDFDMRLKRLVAVEPSQTGYRLDITRTVALIQEHALSQSRQITLPVEILRPTIDTNNLAALGITEQVVKATTTFKGSSEARLNNIKLASARFDGVLLAPGEIFSFNKYLGDVTAKEGYSESLIIWGDRTAVGIGGGICQVSTTAFRAAFYAGLEILERWAHGYRVAFYEPPVGLDATVFSPAIDFKFRNDTPNYLLIKTEMNVEASSLTFYFFGTKTGRTVEMEGPITENPINPGPPEYQDDPTLPAGVVKQVEWPVGGLDVTIKRVVKQGDQIIHKDTFFSRYQPWHAVYLVGKKS